MRKFLAVLLAFSFTAYAPLAQCAAGLDSIAAGEGEFPAPAGVPAAQYYGDSGGYFSPEQLDNLLAPIALYPDPLLAQVLLAATFPDQIDEADREMRASYDHYNVDYAPWDVSVKAVAHYPAVLHMMADKLDWTTSLGQAYVSQSTDVMAAVQRLRRQSRDAGYLVTTRQMEVVETDGYIYCWPAQPRYIYVPVYDPAVVFVPRRGFFAGLVIGFGTGFVIGAWLNHDCDWREHRVFYHGWDRDDGWERRSRPFVQINNVYVNRTYVNVTVNQTVVNNTVNYTSLNNRYNSVHRDVHYDDVRVRRGPGGVPDNGAGRPDDRGRGRDDRVNPGNTGNQGGGNGAGRPDDRGRGRDDRVNQGNPGNQGRGNGGNNKIIDRNINTRDPRIDAYRGHVPVTGMPQRGEDVRTDRPGQIPVTPMPQRSEDARSDRNRTNANPPPPPPPPPNRSTYQPVPRVPDRPNTSVYGGGRGPINANDASRRGQDSRNEMNKPSGPPPNRGRDEGRGGGGRQGGGKSGGDDKQKGGRRQ